MRIKTLPTSFGWALLALCVATAYSFPRAKRDTETTELEEVKIDDKLDKLTAALQQMQQQMKLLQSDEMEAADISTISEGVQTEKFRRRAGVGWQPLKKKRLTWQPLKRNTNGGETKAKFTLRMKDSEDLHSELLRAVEQHLIDDLSAAQQYGIEPEQILEHLRALNNMD